MRVNGFLDVDDRLGTVRDEVAKKQGELIVAAPSENAAEVAAKLKKFGISQLPVVDPATQSAIGMLHESDLLDAMMTGKLKFVGPVAPYIHALHGKVTLDTPVAKLRELFRENNVAVVMEGERALAVVTQIDLIDHLGRVAAQ